MERRFNAFNDTPRGKHWLGADITSESGKSSSYETQNILNRRHADNESDQGNLKDDFYKIPSFDRQNVKSTINNIRYENSNDDNDSKNSGNYRDNYNNRFKNNNADDNVIPLISPTVLEVSRQRQLAILVFLIIQCYKLYDLILLKYGLPVSGLLITNSKFNFLTKYLFLDSIFLFFLPNFNIPKFNFRPFTVFCQIILLGIFTIFLSTDHEFIIVTFIVSFWNKVLHSKDLTVTGSTIKHNKIIDYSNHFKGALTVKILPENTAMLNPFHDSFCLPIESNSFSPYNSINVPIKINSTEEIKFIQLEFRDLYTSTIELKNLTSGDFKISKNIPSSSHATEQDSVTDDSTIRYIDLNLKEIGFYQIKRIIDAKDLNLKVYQSHLILPHCPVATISNKQEINNMDRCVGDSDPISIEILGVPPLKLFYSKIVNDQIYTFKDNNLQPEYFDSPLQSSRKSIFSTKDLDNLKWARSHTVNISLDSLTTIDGQYTYKIDKIIDSLGNTIDFSKINDDDLKDNYDLISTFKVHDIPRASLDERFDSGSPTKKKIIISFENIKHFNEEIPFVANLTFTDANGKDMEKLLTITSLPYEFSADLPGNYKLNSIDSNYCSGVVVGRSSVLITKPIPPHLEVKSSPILDQCVGPIGLDFDLTFTGVPPYHYMVKIYKIDLNKKENNKKLYDTKRLSSNGARNQFKYTPSMEGKYEIIFDNLSNDIFTDPIALLPRNEYTFSTSMRVKPSAVINQRSLLKLCLGDKTKVPISFKGEPPFTLQYDILETSSNKRTSYTINDIKDYNYMIETPNFDVGGDYMVSLVSVRDSSNCLVSLSESDARIKVRRDVPSATFNFLESLSETRIKEGSFAEIPVRLAGEAPFMVKYEHLDFDGKIIGLHESRFQSSYKQSLRTDKEGVYRLIEMRDSSCKGRIDNIDSKYKISFLEKPNFEVQQKNQKLSEVATNVFAKGEICQNLETSIDLSLSGSPPFVLKYELMSPSGEIISKSVQITTKYASIQLPNNEAGEYVATIKAIFDTNYGEQDYTYINGLTREEVVVKQNVNPIPQIVFSNRGKTLRTCSIDVGEDTNSLEPIYLKRLRGQGPYSLSFSIYHESTSRTDHFTIDGVDVDNFPFYKIYEGLKLGKHVVTIESVIDATGCINEFANIEDNYVIISITDVPKIHLLDSNADYCVGDYVSYQLNGVPPFTIRYDFNGVKLKSQERSSQFVRMASEPGTISINSIQDSISQCTVNFTKPNMEEEFKRLSLTIHPIPSVTVSQGYYVVEDIHEGDQAEVTFTFEGTPPFSLTYVRTEDTFNNGKHNNRPQVVETHKVSDIYDFEYKVITSLQGTYEAIEISDAFCFAKNEAFFNN